MRAIVWRLLVTAVVTVAALPLAAQESSRDLEPRNSVGIGVEYEDFDQDGFDPWKLLELQLSHRFGFGSVIARVNEAERFGDDATQIELDAYPKFRPGTYAYLNIGRGEKDSFFPDWRYGAEIFQSLPRSYEASLGARHLDFGQSDVTLYTGSLGKYWGNNWISFRPYVNPADDGTSVSGGVQYRHYGKTADDYVGFGVSYGEAPEENVTLQEIDRLQSASARVMTKRRLNSRGLIFNGTLGWRELEFRAGSERSSYYISAGLQQRF